MSVLKNFRSLWPLAKELEAILTGGDDGDVLTKGATDSDFSWQAPAATGGTVDTANSPNANEFARFTDADTIEGRTTAEARTDLGLVIGTNVQAWSSNLDEYAAVNPTAAGLAILDDADASAQRTTLGAAATSHAHAQADVTNLVADLALKAPLAGPTFTGTVTIPTPFTIGAVSMTATGTELNFVDGVTSAIQTQLDAKLASASYTAADVLAKLLTVDGTGSGIDADLLDGNSSAAFALASHGEHIVPKRVVGMVFDGGGSPPTAGSVGFVVVPFSGNIDRWDIVADASGSAVVDVWKSAGAIPTDGNRIAGTEKLTLSAQQLAADTSLTTWSTLAVAVGDVLGFELESVATCTRITAEIRIQETA